MERVRATDFVVNGPKKIGKKKTVKRASEIVRHIVGDLPYSAGLNQKISLELRLYFIMYFKFMYRFLMEKFFHLER